MPYTHSHIPGLLILEPKVFGDARGFLKEDWFALA
jgi:dTDP-4-dehydrorhamnose 3,5-epimerase-like enzyme